MLLYLTIGILFTYTLLLIAFFMGWCTLIPTKCHPRKGIPFSSVRSPRRNTKFIEISAVSASHSAESLRHILPQRKFSRAMKKHSLTIPPPVRPNDYLHPKYSLPPVSIDAATQWQFECLLRSKAARDLAKKNACQREQTGSEESLPPGVPDIRISVPPRPINDIFVV